MLFSWLLMFVYWRVLVTMHQIVETVDSDFLKLQTNCQPANIGLSPSGINIKLTTKPAGEMMSKRIVSPGQHPVSQISGCSIVSRNQLRADCTGLTGRIHCKQNMWAVGSMPSDSDTLILWHCTDNITHINSNILYTLHVYTHYINYICMSCTSLQPYQVTKQNNKQKLCHFFLRMFFVKSFNRNEDKIL